MFTRRDESHQAGRRELTALRAEAFQQAGLRPDPVDLALTRGGDLDEDILRGYRRSP